MAPKFSFTSPNLGWYTRQFNDMLRAFQKISAMHSNLMPEVTLDSNKEQFYVYQFEN